MVISTISIVLMMTITSTTAMNASALDLGIIPKDIDFGSIDSENRFNCFGAAITCDNDNTVNNNISVNNGTNGGSNPNSACIECFEETLMVNKIESFLIQAGVTSIEEYCSQIQDLNIETVGLELQEFGIGPELAVMIINRLVDAGVLVQ